jgi:tetratricopeptide (TPR) repeat protein
MFLNTGKIKEGLTSLPGIIEGISNYKGKITKHDEAYCMFLIADIYFRNKKFDEALIWLNKLNDEAGVPDDILINAKIFLLVVHFELGNNRLLEYLIRSTYRFLKSKKNPDEAEKAVINFLKKIPSILNTKELFAHFQGTINELERIKSKNPELNLFKRFDFIEYLNSKLEELKNASLNSA